MSEWIMPISTIILSVAIPYVVNVVKKSDWSTNTKRWIAIACSAAGGIGVAFISGTPTPETLVTWVLAVIGGTQTTYAMFKSIGITSQWLDALEGLGSSASKTDDAE